jgi:cobalt-zinc-cadmium efflux system protein
VAHSHGHAAGVKPAPLATALAATAALALFEFGGGLAAHSLALLADSAHVAMDAFALGIALFARAQMRRPANERRSYGYARFEILAALGNGGLLLGITVAIAFEALRRFATPELPQGGLMAWVAGVGLAVNLAIGTALLRSAARDLNVRAALFHVFSDALGALAVGAGGLAVLATGAEWIDPALSLFVAAIILVGVLRIVREAADVLLESAPEHARIPTVRTRMRSLPGVVGVHDLHVWTLGGGSHVLTAHVLLEDARISEASALLRSLEQLLADEFDIDHVTIQFECESCESGDRIVCTKTAG